MIYRNGQFHIVGPRLRILLSVFFALSVAGFGSVIFIKSYTDRDNEQLHLRVRTAQQYVNTLYTEARTAADQAEPAFNQECSPFVIEELSRVVSVLPHIRSVNYIKNQILTCSSISGNHVIQVSHVYPGKREYYTERRSKGGHIFYIVYFPQKAGTIGVAINGYFFKQALQLINSEAEFYPLEDFKKINPPGVAYVNQVYPYAIVWKKDPASIHSFSHILLVIVFVVVASVLSGAFFYTLLEQISSPRYFIKRGVRMHQFYPVYQPVINLNDNKISGFEALLRWNLFPDHPIPPAEFIPLAEQSGMLEELTLYMMANIEKDLNHFADRDIYIAINVEPDMLANNIFLNELLRFGKVCRSRAVQAVVEITERKGISNSASMMNGLIRSRASGLLIALDDFGTGFSNMDTLQHIRPDFIKVDKNFISYSLKGGLPETLLLTIIRLSSDLAIPLIAEGVETPLQLTFLRNLGVPLFQGYIFSPAIAADAAGYLLSSTNTSLY